MAAPGREAAAPVIPLYDLAGLSGPFGVFSFASSASPHRLEMRYGLPEHEFGVLPQGYFRRP